MLMSFKVFLESVYKAQDDESEILHHLTPNKNFTKFRPFSHFGDAKAARNVALQKDNEREARAPSIQNKMTHHAVRIKKGRTVQISDPGNYHGIHDYSRDLHASGHLTDTEHNYITNHRGGENTTTNRLSSILKRKGINTLKYDNEIEGGTGYVITDPNQVRSLKKKDNAKVNYSPNKMHKYPDY